MGEVGFCKGELISEISESVGFKSGLSFSYQRMLKFVSKWSRDILEKNYNSVVGLRPEEYEELYFDVLQGTGYAPTTASPYMHLFTLFLKENYRDDEKKFEIGLKIYELYGQWMRAEIDSLVKSGNMKYGMVISPDSYLELCYEKYGRIGYQLALQLLTNQLNYQNYSPWYNIRVNAPWPVPCADRQSMRQ